MIVKRKILVIDDDDDLRQSLQEQITLTDEYKVFAAETAAKGIELIKDQLPDLLVLDVGLPDMDGREVCKRLRKQHFKKPILLLAGNSTDADQILGFEWGANDYVTKPFKFPVLLARIRVHLRQHDQGEDAVFVIGPYSFKPAGKVLFCQRGSKIRLTEKETLMLKRLNEAGGKAVSRKDLMREVWGCNSDAASRTLDTHIYRLRQKIEKESSRSELLITEGHGYRLILNGNPSSLPHADLDH
jgi:DNA-binding response OmpR family regulator